MFHPRPWTPWFVFGELAIAGVFGLGGGAFLGWIHWRASEEGRARLARECAKLDPDAERALAEEGMGKELAAQPGVLQSRCRGPAAPA